MPSLTPWIAGAVAMIGASASVSAQSITFPPDAGVIDVRQAYGAKGDGIADDTAAILKAMQEHPAGIVYLPDGTYLISDTLAWPAPQRGLTLQGQSMAGTIIRLKDACPGFTDPANPRAMVWTGKAPAQRFRNYLRNLTLDTARGNPGAIGAQYIANNAGGIFDVTVQSGDGSGPIGLDLGYTNEQGPCLIKNVTVRGFHTGISSRHDVDSITFEHVRLVGQAGVGFRNQGQCVSIRGLHAQDVNVPIENLGANSVMVLVDSTCTRAADAPAGPAVTNTGVLFARNLVVEGFKVAVDNQAGSRQAAEGPRVDEFVSHPVSTLFGGAAKSLNLPIQETPDVPWDDPRDWASVAKFGAGAGGNDAEAIQKAIDSGATTIYFPRTQRRYRLSGTVLIRGKVRRIIGCESTVDLANQDAPAFRLIEGDAPVVVFERFAHFGYNPTPCLDNASARTLVVRNCSACNGANTGSGDIFLEDVVANIRGRWLFARQNVWARQLNVENRLGTPFVVNPGGNLWILGYKTENHGTLIETHSGGRTELLGGFAYALGGAQPDPMFVVRDAQMSATIGEWHYGGSPATQARADHPVPYGVLVRETRGGATRELKHGDVPKRGPGSAIPLYVGRPPTPQP